MAITLDPPLLARYTGRYEIAPGLVIGVDQEGDVLTAQMAGEAKAEIFAESATTFFFKIVDARIEFVLDGSGQVTGLVFQQGAQSYPGKKIS